MERTMIWIIFTLAAVFASLRGVKEGMIHILPGDYTFNHLAQYGVRGHIWFQVYHAIGFAKMVSFTALIHLIANHTPCWQHLVALLIILWEIYEVAYSYSRYFRLIPKEELITFVDIIHWRLLGDEVWVIHGLRILLITMLILIGGTV